MPESNTSNTSDDSAESQDAAAESSEQSPKIRFSLKKTPEPAPPATSGEQAEPEPKAEPRPMKLSLDKSQDTDSGETAGGAVEEQPAQPGSEEATPWDVKANPVEGGPRLKLGVKRKIPSEAEKEEPAPPAPVPAAEATAAPEVEVPVPEGERFYQLSYGPTENGGCLKNPIRLS